MINKFILKHWCCLTAVEKLSGIFKFLLLISFKRDILQHLDSRIYNQAAHFLSHPTPGNLLCADCAQCNDMSRGNYFYHPHKGKRYESHHMLTFCTVFILTLNAWLGWSIQGDIFYCRNLFLKMNASGDKYKRKGPNLLSFSEVSGASMSESHLFSALKKLIGITAMDRQRKDEVNRFFLWHKGEAQKKGPGNISEWKLKAKSLAPSAALQDEKPSAVIV